MARSKVKKKKTTSNPVDEIPVDETKIPIPNLPDNFFWVKVNSGTKMKNVLEYSLKEFPSKKSIVWSGTGQGVGKVISCAEIFKKKTSGLHQITKLRYVQSPSSSGKTENESLKNRMVPQIHILLSSDVLDTNEPGYQKPGICPLFQDPEVAGNPEKLTNKRDYQGNRKTRMPDVIAEEFASMGLRTGQKRPRQQNQSHGSKKNKKKKSNNGNRSLP